MEVFIEIHASWVCADREYRAYHFDVERCMDYLL